MLLPELTYGLTKDVKRRASRIITKLKRGASWREATQGPMLDTAEHPGLIVLDGPSRLVGGTSHFHVYILLQEALDAMLPQRARLSLEMRAGLFAAALEEAWSTLALQGRANQTWLWPVENHLPFVRASIRFWSSFDDALRYSSGDDQGNWLWNINPMIHYVLVNLGVPPEALATPVHTAEDLRALAVAHGIAV